MYLSLSLSLSLYLSLSLFYVGQVMFTYKANVWSTSFAASCYRLGVDGMCKSDPVDGEVNPQDGRSWKFPSMRKGTSTPENCIKGCQARGLLVDRIEHGCSETACPSCLCARDQGRG